MNLINKTFISAGLLTGVENLGQNLVCDRVFEIALNREIFLGESFYQGGGNLRSECDHLNFFKPEKNIL